MVCGVTHSVFRFLLLYRVGVSSISASRSSSKFGGYAVPYCSGLYVVCPCVARFVLVLGVACSGSWYAVFCLERWYAVSVAWVLGADGVGVLLGVCCGGVALFVALVVAFLV